MALLSVQTLQINKMENINIEYLTRYNIHVNKTYVFTPDKPELSYLEQIIHYICTMHKEKLIHDTYFIEFTVTSIPSQLTTIHPCNTHDNSLLSTITCLNTKNISFLFTEITPDDYKYKSFDKTGLHLVASSNMTHMCFSPKYIYSTIVENSTHINYILNVKFVKTRPIDSICYNQPPAFTIQYQRYLINSNPVLCKKNEVNNVLTYSFFNSLLYDIDANHKYKDILQFDSSNTWVHVIDKKNITIAKLQHDIINIKSSDIKFDNRFLQRFFISGYLQKEYVRHMVSTQPSNYDIIDNKNRCIDINIFNSQFFKYILSKVNECYNLNTNELCLDPRLITYLKTSQSIIQYKHNCDIVVYYIIDGGDITFEFWDNIKMVLKCGDMLVLSGRLEHNSELFDVGCTILCVKITIPK